jgi:hypothetical protein
MLVYCHYQLLSLIAKTSSGQPSLTEFEFCRGRFGKNIRQPGMGTMPWCERKKTTPASFRC